MFKQKLCSSFFLSTFEWNQVERLGRILVLIRFYVIYFFSSKKKVRLFDL